MSAAAGGRRSARRVRRAGVHRGFLEVRRLSYGAALLRATELLEQEEPSEFSPEEVRFRTYLVTAGLAAILRVVPPHELAAITERVRRERAEIVRASDSSAGIRWPRFQEQIAGHLGKADFVPVDVSGFTPAQAGMVQDFVDQLGSRVFTVK
ncbi:hypothetical protein [Kribbella catacumbae]|uniref:hypothetical protein n=1 Tax=Kribbella catacumbae TaxID=460086 RepID=UPI000369F727|nr:hypothetical protein [Kribbella catacumbae]